MPLSLSAPVILFASLAAGVSLLAAPQARSDVRRTVYVTATDQAGRDVSDLVPADLTVKEGGKARQIVRVEPSRARLKIALAVDQMFSPDGVIRRAALGFLQHFGGSADMALYVMGRRNEKRVDYTTDLLPFISAVNAFPASPQLSGDVVGALFEIAKDQHALEGRRVIVTLAPEIPQLSSVTANGVLDQLRDNGVVLYAATLVGLSTSGGSLTEAPATRLEGGDLTTQMEGDKVLNDGTKQSGGLRVPSGRSEGFQAALDRIAGDLQHQYAVTYVIAAGSKSDGRLSIDAKRKGLTVRGPRQVPKI